MFEISKNAENKLEGGAKIKVIGVGGGGCNAVNTMIKSGLTGVEYIVANTDVQALRANLAPSKVQLGIQITKGLGAGANPEVGRKAALDEYERLSEVLQGADMVFITAGMGGGTGTGAAPVIAKLAKELGALTVGVVTKPFLFEGKKRFRVAEEGIAGLEESVDSLITIPNQRLLHIAGENLSLIDTFKKADEVLLNAVRGISDLINSTGHINADFADVSTVMSNKGLALMGTGMAKGPDRAIKSATEAISSPLLEDISIDGATGIIINISGSQAMTMHEVNEAVTLIMEAADDNAEIIFGTVIDDTLEDNVKVTVIATGLGGQLRVKNAIKEMPVKKEEQSASNAKQHHPKHAEEVQSTSKEIRINVEAKHEEVRPNLVTRTSPNADQDSPLARSIRDAANRYETTKQGEIESSLENSNEVINANKNSSDKSDVTKAGKARTIAEKLGFINFDEEQLDTPSFLRKEKDSSNDNLGPTV